MGLSGGEPPLHKVTTEEKILSALLEVKYTSCKKELLDREVAIESSYRTLTRLVDELHYLIGFTMDEINRLNKSISEDLILYRDRAYKYIKYGLIDDDFYDHCVNYTRVYFEHLNSISIIINNKKNKK